jgi:peptidyl-prolyl cis-trans isomerase C
MKSTFPRVVFAIFVSVVLIGCRKSEPVIATVGDTRLTVAEYERRLREMNPAYQQYAATPEGRKQFLELLIREKIVVEQSRRAGTQRDSEYRKRVAGYRNEMKRRLEDLKQSLLFDLYIRKLRSGEVGVTDADVETYYRNHIEEFKTPKEHQASHILVSTLTEAEELIGRLKKGEPFDKLAQELSKDPTTAPNGGRLAPVRTASLMPETMKEAIFKLEEGKLSDPIKTEFGYHVLKKTGTRLLPTRNYDQAKEEIRERLERLKFDEWVEKSRKTLPITVNEAALPENPKP